ncbi:MAG TPA: Dna2/Cas4 domain-containing protein [Azospirillaceae bacterium]|nr:Dna2/Cas4 domain-containing protein [Azospirillaceae bacterium]
MEDDNLLVPLSALQHHLYCPRQCALIHLEGLWSENRFTAEGRILHERAHGGGEREARIGADRPRPALAASRHGPDRRRRRG